MTASTPSFDNTQRRSAIVGLEPGDVMRTVDPDEAKTELARWLQVVEAGRKVSIARAGPNATALAELAPTPAARPLGLLQGQFSVPDNFDAALSDGTTALFEGR